MNNSGVYKITNMANGRFYIGSAINLRCRKSTHFHNLILNQHDNSKLQHAFNKYGGENFIFSVLLYCSREMLIYYEQRAIDTLKPFYNICPIAGSTNGYKHTEETKRKISIVHKGKPLTDDHKKNLGIARRGNKNSLGYKHTEETKEKMRLSHMGNKNALGNIGFLGKKHTEEAREKIRLSSIGRFPSDETRKKLSAVHKGKPFTEEHKQKIRAALIAFRASQTGEEIE